MKITSKKVSITLCGVAMISTMIVGFDANSKLNKINDTIATLEEKLEIKDSTIQELEKSTNSLQEELNSVRNELTEVKGEVKKISD